MSSEALAKEGLRTEKVLEVIVNWLSNPRYFKELNGSRWAKINLKYCAKAAKCTPRTIIKHLNLLIERRIVIKAQLSKDYGDCSNWYSIDPACLSCENPETLHLFSPPIAKKIRDIFIS